MKNVSKCIKCFGRGFLSLKLKTKNLKAMVLSVTGKFATRTVSTYNYYVCPRNWNVENVKYLSVHYDKKLVYLGKIKEIEEFNKNDLLNKTLQFKKPVPNTIIEDLIEQENCMGAEEHYLFLLEPIIKPCNINDITPNSWFYYKGRGPFVQSHQKITLQELFDRHENKND